MSVVAGVQANLTPFVHEDKDGAKTMHMMVEGIHCANCIKNIERALKTFPELDMGRVNLSTKRLTVKWSEPDFDPNRIGELLADKGFRVAPFNPEVLEGREAREEKRLLLALAVAGFAAANVMLLSVSVWSGGDAMGVGTRTLFHWLSAMIALPTIAYSGRPFFTSALEAIRGGRLNMDVPISIAILLAAGLSVVKTMHNAEHAYFDASVSLLFFLLIGRYLDQRAKAKARSAGEHLMALNAVSANVVMDDGRVVQQALSDVVVSMRVAVFPGERVPVDGRVLEGRSDVDTSLVTGEAVPEAVDEGAQLHAGTMNLTGKIVMVVEAVGEGTLLAEIARLMENAEQGRGRYVRLADRAAQVYAPLVHLAGLFTFLGWWFIGGMPWTGAMEIGIAVLIITCPCALGLAVPAVQVVAASRLFSNGIILKSGDALERISEVDVVVFDKTGTLTEGKPVLVNAADIAPDVLERAASMAHVSKHPLSQALALAVPDAAPLEGVKEEPGLGLEGASSRLGSRVWVGVEGAANDHTGPELWYREGQGEAHCFLFVDQLKVDAKHVVAALIAKGQDVHLLSGDREASARYAGLEAGIPAANIHAEMSPSNKVGMINSLRDLGHKVLMVGDGMNDAPALKAANVSASPASAAQISQVASDIIFQGHDLAPVLEVYRTSRKAHKLVWQNFAFAALYNVIAVPLAAMGYATPLVAAIAMSSSSIIVVTNALRARRG